MVWAWFGVVGMQTANMKCWQRRKKREYFYRVSRERDSIGKPVKYKKIKELGYFFKMISVKF